MRGEPGVRPCPFAVHTPGCVARAPWPLGGRDGGYPTLTVMVLVASGRCLR